MVSRMQTQLVWEDGFPLNGNGKLNVKKHQDMQKCEAIFVVNGIFGVKNLESF